MKLVLKSNLKLFWFVFACTIYNRKMNKSKLAWHIRGWIEWNYMEINPLSANPTKWPSTLKQFVAKLPTNCLSVFDHFVKLALKELKRWIDRLLTTITRGIVEYSNLIMEAHHQTAGTVASLSLFWTYSRCYCSRIFYWLILLFSRWNTSFVKTILWKPWNL